MSRVLAKYRSSIPGRVIPKTQKWYLIAPCLALSIIRYGSRVKGSNSGKGVAPFPTPRWSSYWKGSLWVTLNSNHKIFILLLNGQEIFSFFRFEHFKGIILIWILPRCNIFSGFWLHSNIHTYIHTYIHSVLVMRLTSISWKSSIPWTLESMESPLFLITPMFTLSWTGSTC